jgi:hypothetical protein
VNEVAVCTVWQGTMLRTVGDHLDAMAAVTTKEEAAEFRRIVGQAHGQDERFALHFGWLLGEFDTEERHRLEDLFEIEHPLFGRHDPDPAHLMLAGMMFGDGVPIPVIRRHFGWDE